jgi:hypothetical protein
MAVRKAKTAQINETASASNSTPARSVRAKSYHDYKNFTSIDGSHPWQQQVPEGFVSYEVRELQRGKILYFNYQLAKEMGLIPNIHPHRMNPELEKTLLKTFSIRIINEHDELARRRYPSETKKSKPYMATRYLQLQHPNKQGKTSGDGRSIWNGTVENRRKIWDVSSRGTGVTKLSPGSVLAGKPLASGDYSVGYGCGTADIDELMGAAIMSEVYHCQGIKTERTLAVIDLDGTVGVGVRASTNLIRPAHLFMHLKQNNLSACKRSTDYLIDRQVQNREWNLEPKKNKYWQMAQMISHEFAWFAARLDVDYIFAWLDWDGDNILANAAIIDYGSIRQFGLRHDQYRYDDIERFSTNLNEQKQKTRLIVQTFTQLADYIVHGSKKTLESYRKHRNVTNFDREFNFAIVYWRLFRMGLNDAQARSVYRRKSGWLKQLMTDYTYIERKKTHRKLFKVADGVHRPAILNLRKLLVLLSEKASTVEHLNSPLLSAKEMFSGILSGNARGKDKRLTQTITHRLTRFEKNYRLLLKSIPLDGDPKQALAAIEKRAAVINRPDRMTGNGIENVVQSLLAAYSKGTSTDDLQEVIEALIADQILTPEPHGPISKASAQEHPALLDQLFAILQDFQEDI